jgi:hypothetical protein
MDEHMRRIKAGVSVGLQRLNRFLRLFCAMMMQLRLRDRLVKVIQYGCQMIIGYWGQRIREMEELQRRMAVAAVVPAVIVGGGATTSAATPSAAVSESLVTRLALLRRTASTSRKAFWLLKFMNNLMEINNAVGIYLFDKEKTLSTVQVVDTIEHVFLSMYYYYESLIFFARCKMFGLEESKLEFMCNLSWFAGDVSYMISSSMRLLDRRREYHEGLRLDSLKLTGQGHGHGWGIFYKPAEVTASICNTSTLDFVDVKLLRRNLFDAYLSVAIALLELGVSVHYMDIYKYLLGRHISEGHVGLMGVCSSALILFEGYLKQDRTIPL